MKQKQKNDAWGVVPRGLTAILSLIVIVCSLFIFKYSPYISVVVFVCAALVLAEKFIFQATRYLKMKEYIKDVTEDDESQNYEALFKTLNPIAGIRIDGSIAWYNTSFSKLFGSISDKRISELIPDFKVRDIYNQRKNNLTLNIGEDIYNATLIFKRKSDAEHASIMVYFEKITELVHLKKELEDTKNVVAQILVDNFDEAVDDVPDEDRIDVITLIEKNIIGWAQDAGGFVKKLEKDRYVCVFSKKQLDEFIENKFDILTNIKTFNQTVKVPPTISMGIGAGENSLLDNDISSKKALEMALGRGGDQVVIREGDKYTYFGGNSRETEKRTKVKVRIMAHNLHELILNADNVIIMGHKNSDIDAVGSAIGISSMASFLNKDVKILLTTEDNSVHFVLDKIDENHYHDGLFIGKSGVKEFIKPNTLLIVTDTHVPGYTEMPELLDLVKTKVVIDHHRRSESFISDADIVYHEPFASSACEMVAEIMQYFDPHYSVSTIDAEVIYAGIVIDTKNFVYKTGVRTFEAAAYLRNSGVDTIKVKRFFRESIDNYKVKSEIVTNSEIYKDNIAISVYPEFVPHPVAASAADEMLEISDVKASFVLTKEEDGNINISGRSLGDINVQIILEKLGGGGHFMVAGAQLSDTTLEEALDKLKNVIDEM